MSKKEDELQATDRAAFDAFWDRARAQSDTLTPDEVREMLTEYLRAQEAARAKKAPKRTRTAFSAMSSTRTTRRKR